ncbi:MAG: ATP-dependent nuclease [Thermoproteota archaeon]|jgi:ABC-type branched-subunit amino acid transport system ATPase component
MIKRLEIRNFRGVKEGNIELAPLTILLGPNNSGKTTILEALFLAPNPFRAVPYGVSKSAVEIVHWMHKTLESEGYAFLFHNYVEKFAEIKCDDYLLKFYNEGRKILVVSNKETGGSTTLIEGINFYWIGTLSSSTNSFPGPLPITNILLAEDTLLISSNLLKEGMEYLKANWASIINLGIYKKVAEESSSFVYEKYNDLTIEPFLDGKLAIYVYLRDGRRIRLGDLGEGIQSYIIMRILYELRKPKILLFDVIESHFNPRILNNIAEWLSNLVSNGVQVVLTTHSLEATRIIASLNEKSKIYLTSLEEGSLKSKTLSLEEVEEFLNAGVDVRMVESLL